MSEEIERKLTRFVIMKLRMKFQMLNIGMNTEWELYMYTEFDRLESLE